MPLADGDSGKAAPCFAFGHVAHDTAFGRYSGVRADLDVIEDRRRSADHDVVANFNAACDAGLTRQHAMAADTDIVGDLNEVIDHRTAADDRIAKRSAIDGGITADLDTIFDDHPPQLRLTQQSSGCRNEAKSFAPNTAIAPDADPGTDERPAQRAVRTDETIVTKGNAVANHRIGFDVASLADCDITADLYAGIDLASGPDHGARINEGRLVDSRLERADRIEKAANERECKTRIGDIEEAISLGHQPAELSGCYHRSGTAARRGALIGTIAEQADVGGPGDIQRGQIMHCVICKRRNRKVRADMLRDISQGKGTTSAKEPRIGHEILVSTTSHC